MNAADSDMSKDDAVETLTNLVSRLQGLKIKLEEDSEAQNLQEQRIVARLNHLESVDGDDWSDMRMNRILVDYMLRMSYHETAMKLAESNNMQDLVDCHIFQEGRKIIHALQHGELAPALAWFARNKSQLKKSKSEFEFYLRLQEFIELVRAEDRTRAIAYARESLVPSWGVSHFKEFKQAMATLAFKSHAERLTNKDTQGFFEQKTWYNLADLFKQDFCKVYGMTSEPLLNIYLQAGLSVLKTLHCHGDNCPKEDPLSHEGLRRLAEPLPYNIPTARSKLVCYITKELMDDENPPQTLPNGYVYSTQALQDMAEKNNCIITCPRTGFICNYNEVVRVYIS